MGQNEEGRGLVPSVGWLSKPVSEAKIVLAGFEGVSRTAL